MRTLQALLIVIGATASKHETRDCCSCERPGSRPSHRPSHRPRADAPDSVYPSRVSQADTLPVSLGFTGPPTRPLRPSPSPVSPPLSVPHLASYLFGGRDDDARLTFFSSSTCEAYDGSRGGDELETTGVVGPRSTPGVNPQCWQDIAVVCDVSQTGLALPSGEIKFFSSATNSACSSQVGPTVRFTDDTCEPASFGAHALNAQCTLPLVPVSPLPGRVTVAFSQSTNCEPSGLRLLYDFRSGVCQNGPQNTGFIVTCNINGTSSYSLFTDASCSTLRYVSGARDQDVCIHQAQAFQEFYPIPGSYATRCGTFRA